MTPAETQAKPVDAAGAAAANPAPAVKRHLVLLGAGLGKPALAADWPAGTRLFGELGRLYDADWLAAHGWRATLAEVMADKPAARGARGRGSKKS